MTNRDAIVTAVAEAAGVSKDTLKDSTDLVKDLQLDSLAIVELSLKLEEDLKVTLPDEELQKATTLGKLVELVDRLAASK